MSRVHSPSMYPRRSGGPRYCKACDVDWPCAGSQMEDADARRESRTLAEIRAEAAAAERARLAEAVRGLPVRGLFGEGPGAVTVGRAAVLALLDPQP